MFRGGIELSYKRDPHKQLLKDNVFDGHPIDYHNKETVVNVMHASNNQMQIDLQALYGRGGFYQIKWWVMLPFSEDVSVDGDLVDVFINSAKDVAGLEYGRHWTRIKLYPVKSGMSVKVGRFTFTIRNSDLKNLMIYRRLDNSLIELEWIWWNADRDGPIPRKWFFTNAIIDVNGGVG